MRSSCGALIAFHISQLMVRLLCAAAFFCVYNSVFTAHHPPHIAQGPSATLYSGPVARAPALVFGLLYVSVYLFPVHPFIVFTAITLPTYGVDVSTWWMAVLVFLLMRFFCALFLRTARIRGLYLFFLQCSLLHGRTSRRGGGKWQQRKQARACCVCRRPRHRKWCACGRCKNHYLCAIGGVRHSPTFQLPKHQCKRQTVP